MSRFVGKGLKKIVLWEIEVIKDWKTVKEEERVKIPKALSFDNMSKITSETDATIMSKKMLIICIKEWNIKDENDKIPEVNEANIITLDVETIKVITEKITEMITPETKEESKKKSKN